MSIGKGILAFVAVLIVVNPLIDLTSTNSLDKSGHLFLSIATFFSILWLHYFLWRFIIPIGLSPNAELTSFFPSQKSLYQTGFYKGTISFGYILILIYCSEIAGFQLRHDSTGHMGFLMFGLSMLGLGTIVRLREVFIVLGSRH